MSMRAAQIEVIATTEVPDDLVLKEIANKLKAKDLSIDGYAVNIKKVIVKTAFASVFVLGQKLQEKTQNEDI